MSIYLNNLNPEIIAKISAGSIAFYNGNRSIDMTCKRTSAGYEMIFALSETVKTIIKAKNSKEIAYKLPLTVNEIFKCYSLKGML